MLVVLVLHPFLGPSPSRALLCTCGSAEADSVEAGTPGWWAWPGSTPPSPQ